MQIYENGLFVAIPFGYMLGLSLLRRLLFQKVFPMLFPYRWFKMDKDRQDKRCTHIMMSVHFLAVFAYATLPIFDSILLRRHSTSYWVNEFRIIIPMAFISYLFELISDRELAMGPTIHHFVVVIIGCFLYLEHSYYEPLLLFGYFATLDFVIYFSTNVAFLVNSTRLRLVYLRAAMVVYPVVAVGRAVLTFAYIVWLWVQNGGQDTPFAVVLCCALFVFLFAEFQFEKWMIYTYKKERKKVFGTPEGSVISEVNETNESKIERNASQNSIRGGGGGMDDDMSSTGERLLVN